MKRLRIYRDKVRLYIYHVLIAFDMFCNVLTGGLNDETISSRWERNNYIGGPFISHLGSVILTWIEPHHGSEAVENDRERAEVAEQTETKTENKNV